MAYVTPSDWLPYLTKNLDAQARENLRLRAYMDGSQPGQEMSKDARASWLRLQKKANVVYARLIVRSLAARVVPTSFTVADGEHTDAQDMARTIARRSRLDVAFTDLVEDVIAVGRGFLCVAKDSFGQVLITFESSDTAYAVADPLDPTNLRAAVKVWRDDVDGRDYARVWTPTSRQDFVRASTRTDSKALRTTNTGGWAPLSDEIPADGVPLTMVENRGNGASAFAHVTHILDRISHTVLSLLVTIAFQAFKLRYFAGLGFDPDSPEDEEKAKKLLEISPGAIFDLGDEGELKELGATDFRPMLDAIDDFVRELAATTSTPISALSPDSANQSAEGALAQREAQIHEALNLQKRVGAPIEGAMLKGLRMHFGAGFQQDIELGWMNPYLSTPSERSNAAIQAKAVGIPFKVLAVDYLGHTPEQADKMQTQREDEAFLASLTELTPTPPAASAA